MTSRSAGVAFLPRLARLAECYNILNCLGLLLYDLLAWQLLRQRGTLHVDVTASSRSRQSLDGSTGMLSTLNRRRFWIEIFCYRLLTARKAPSFGR